MRNLTAELTLDSHARKKTSKTFNVRLRVHYRTATLRPFQDEGLTFLEAIYLNAPRRHREGSVLGSIGRKFMQYFADSIVEEISTALSRMRWLFVIARNSSFTYKGRGVEVKQVGRELAVCYVLKGSVR
jgi:hypothetical protein